MPKKKAIQTEFPDKEWEKFLTTNLGRALDEFVKIKEEIAKAQENLGLAADLVLIEMKKAGKDYIKPQINGVFYEFLITKKVKLAFKVAKS